MIFSKIEKIISNWEVLEVTCEIFSKSQFEEGSHISPSSNPSLLGGLPIFLIFVFEAPINPVMDYHCKWLNIL